MASDEFGASGIPYKEVSLSQPFNYPGDAAVETAQFIVKNGGTATARGRPTIETLWADITILQPECIPFDIPNRGLNPRYAALEIASLLGGVPVDVHQRETTRGLARYQDASIQRGNYGVRLRNQLRDFVWKLTDDNGSRQAVLAVWNDRDLIDESKDVPCTLHVQGFIRDSMFYMRTTMRSNDVYLGLPYDLHQFCALQATIAQVLDVQCGFYRHSVGSLHCYISDIDRVMEMSVPTDEPEGDALWHISDNIDDPVQRLQHVVEFCQSALYGLTLNPMTDFERWIAESL